MKNPKSFNKQVLNTNDQIVNTLNLLSQLGLTRITIRSTINKESNNISKISWSSQKSSRSNCGNAFTTLNQYFHICESKAYQCMLKDGSIIRVSFKFNKNILQEENLLYWPAPFNLDEYDDIDENGESIIDIHGIKEIVLEKFLELSDSLNFNELKMRSPIRYDYDCNCVSQEHPPAHIHMQNSECRLSAQKPICFNTFMKFILLNFYKKYRLPEIINLQTISYSDYTKIDNPIISL